MAQASQLDQETDRPGLRVELFVLDLPRSVAFYGDILGFEVRRVGPTGYTSISRDGAVIGLKDVKRLPFDHPARPEPGQTLGLGVELVVMVEDVAALYARATASTAQVSALVAQAWGLTDFRVTDPDGYYIRITGLSTA